METHPKESWREGVWVQKSRTHGAQWGKGQRRRRFSKRRGEGGNREKFLGACLGWNWGGFVRRVKGVTSALNLHSLGPRVCEGMTSGN